MCYNSTIDNTLNYFCYEYSTGFVIITKSSLIINQLATNPEFKDAGNFDGAQVFISKDLKKDLPTAKFRAKLKKNLLSFSSCP